jgi:hypothetical protein
LFTPHPVEALNCRYFPQGNGIETLASPLLFLVRVTASQEGGKSHEREKRSRSDALWR